MSEANAEELVGNVQKSAQTCLTVLTHLEKALRDGGFTGGTSSYRQMTDTILEQNRWVREQASDDLKLTYRRIAKSAENISDILKPYTSMMDKLHRGLRLTTPVVDETQKLPEDPSGKSATPSNRKQEDSGQSLRQRIRNEVISRKKGVSVSILCGTLGVPRKEVSEALKQMVADNQLFLSKKGSRTLYFPPDRKTKNK